MSIITVGSTTALTSALAQAHSGDTIRLQSGQYDGLIMKNLTFSQDVTITSADPLHKAVLTNFDMTRVTGVTVSNVELLVNGPGYSGFNVRYSSDVHFDHVNVHGSLDGDPSNDAKGISFSGSSDISITNSEFQELGVGAAVTNGSNVQVSGNIVHNLRSDGFDFSQVDHVTVSGNSFTNFHPVEGDHADAIQFWTTGTTAASHDITISNNVVTVGAGTGSQGIFIRDGVGNLTFKNLTITGNLIDGGLFNGIRVSDANGLVISDNTLTTPVGGNMVRLEIDNSANVVSKNNQAVSFLINNVSQLTQSGDQLNSVMADSGNTVLANWLHAHGQDALYSSLKYTVSQVAMDTLGTPNLATQALSSHQNVVSVDVMDPTATVLKTAGGGAAGGIVTSIGNGLGDSITGTSGSNLIYGLGGNDTLDGGGGTDTLVGGAGDDVYYVPNTLAVVVEDAGGGNDTVIAKGDYTLSANVENLVINSTVTNGWKATGNDLANKITGNAGNNLIDGVAGNDTIDAGAGNDTLVGGAGDDRLTGGVGLDTFRFGLHSGHDVITDFGVGPEKDTIDISAYKNAGLTPTLHDVGKDLVISFSSGDTITLLNVHAHDLTTTATGWVF